MSAQIPYSILIVDDEPLIRRSLYEILKISGYDTHMAASAEEAINLFENKKFDIVITDLQLPQLSGLELIIFIKKISPATEVILVTGYGSIETAVEAMKKGAFDYITKPIVDDEIKFLIERIIEKKTLLEENKNLRQLVSKSKRDSFCGMIGASVPMLTIYNLIESVASTDATIMITGESGTGKGVVARAIHQCDQKRRNMSFVELSCGALSETLLESELFGHVKGAFTGAIKDKIGRFELAHNGTIFLDEIDTCSPNLQVKLLRILQDGGFERVGGTQTLKTNARVIVATNQDLEKLVEEGSFREDLYYRIHVIPLIIPPLRERTHDIPLLVQHFILASNTKNNKNVTDIDEEVQKLFLNHPWPGNIRQLENVIEGAVIMARKAIITREDLPQNFEKTKMKTEVKSFQEELKEPAKEIILNALKECNWNRSKAAVNLGINRTTLYNKMQKYGIRFKD
ncbi:MAG: sigma-54-dependent Fis family transcriptional regulator [Candidatus Omnitrophica bacterium]|nr:sigma-54-dependent Fis family transcriptional regulator [Candidatus Omnitrophota bacterium]